MGLVRKVKRGIKKVLRAVGLYPPLPPPPPSVRKDVTVIPVQPNVQFLVYWKVLRIGKGSAVILDAYGDEVLKYDCFGAGKGHYHVAPNYFTRIFFVEASAHAQAERACADLEANGIKYLSIHPDPQIRALEVDREAFVQALEQVKERLHYFLDTVEELRDVPVVTGETQS